MSTPSGTLHVVNMASVGANTGTKRRLTAVEIATLLEASSYSDFDYTEFYVSDDHATFQMYAICNSQCPE